MPDLVNYSLSLSKIPMDCGSHSEPPRCHHPAPTDPTPTQDRCPTADYKRDFMDVSS